MSEKGLDEADVVEMGEGPPLKLEKLPKPPKAIHILGLGIILAAMGIGMGKMVMLPLMGARTRIK